MSGSASSLLEPPSNWANESAIFGARVGQTLPLREWDHGPLCECALPSPARQRRLFISVIQLLPFASSSLGTAERRSKGTEEDREKWRHRQLQARMLCSRRVPGRQHRRPLASDRATVGGTHLDTRKIAWVRRCAHTPSSHFPQPSVCLFTSYCLLLLPSIVSISPPTTTPALNSSFLTLKYILITSGHISRFFKEWPSRLQCYIIINTIIVSCRLCATTVRPIWCIHADRAERHK